MKEQSNDKDIWCFTISSIPDTSLLDQIPSPGIFTTGISCATNH
jgi:hypothetical protein